MRNGFLIFILMLATIVATPSIVASEPFPGDPNDAAFDPDWDPEALSGGADIEAVLVTRAKSTGTARPGGTEYDSASISRFIDPSSTRWIAWNATPTVSRKDRRASAALLWGGGGFGTDDFIRLTIIAPDGRSASVDMDLNNAYGAHRRSDPMNVIFGAPDAAPDALRIDAFGPTAGRAMILNEGGAFNRLFNRSGTYRFHFSFRNAHSNSAGHGEIYLLIAK